MMTKIYLAMVNQYMQMQGKGNTFVFLLSFKLKVLTIHVSVVFEK